jgi:hypothetical protein
MGREKSVDLSEARAGAFRVAGLLGRAAGGLWRQRRAIHFSLDMDTLHQLVLSVALTHQFKRVFGFW